jgi:hypothetical protein
VRHWYLGIALLSVTGCDRPEFDDCEKRVMADLTSPSSYRRVSADTVRDTSKKPPIDMVSIDYDAQNAYGATVRDRVICQYFVKDGKPQLEGMIRMDNGVRSAMGRLRGSE